MKWKNRTPREYYSKYERVSIENDQGWFEVYRLPGEVYAICEPQHFQEVNSYLVIGRHRSLLLDTGMGIGNIKSLVEELYDGQVMVVNSHFHFDHIGDNSRFDQIHIYDDSYAENIAEKGLKRESLGNQLDEDMFLYDYPKGFDPEMFTIQPYKVKKITEGYVFDLGNRRLTVVHTPGHSKDSLMLYDEDNRILFTGDTFYLGALYAHFDCREFGKSNIEDYYKTMKMLGDEYGNVEALYCSHNDFIVDPGKISETEEALREIINNQSKEASQSKAAHSYLENEAQIKEYKFDGFSIVAK